MKKLIYLLGMTACIFAAHAQSAGDESLFIIFSPNSAELQAVSQEQAIQNSKTFTSVAQLLLDNPKYRILIDGHANSVIRTSAEEKEQLKPLSEQRAEAAANFLVEYFGVARYRLILTGAGGRFPSETQDPSLNRRVSFIVIAYQ
jgi:outer membrane protein OmpA-like peptidoglycan-associated protein